MYKTIKQEITFFGIGNVLQNLYSIFWNGEVISNQREERERDISDYVCHIFHLPPLGRFVLIPGIIWNIVFLFFRQMISLPL